MNDRSFLRTGLLATLFSVTALSGFGYNNAEPDASFETPKPLLENAIDSVADYVDLFSGSNIFERLFDGERGSSQAEYIDDSWQVSMRHEQEVLARPDYQQAMQKYLHGIRNARHMDLLHQAEFVNSYVNNYIYYVHDDANFGTEEYFASGAESVMNRTGDCDDYAIMKYSTLRAFGVPAHRLYLCSVTATDAQGEGGHLILLMNVGKEKPHFVTLDNRSYTLREPLETVPGDYKPYKYDAAVNENGVWLARADKEVVIERRVTPRPAPKPVPEQTVVDITPKPAPEPAPATVTPAPQDNLIYGHTPAYWLQRLAVGAGVFAGAMTLVNAASDAKKKKEMEQLAAIRVKSRLAEQMAGRFNKTGASSSRQPSNAQKTLDLLARVAAAQKQANVKFA